MVHEYIIDHIVYMANSDAIFTLFTAAVANNIYYITGESQLQSAKPNDPSSLIAPSVRRLPLMGFSTASSAFSSYPQGFHNVVPQALNLPTKTTYYLNLNIMTSAITDTWYRLSEEVSCGEHYKHHLSNDTITKYGVEHNNVDRKHLVAMDGYGW